MKKVDDSGSDTFTIPFVSFPCPECGQELSYPYKESQHAETCSDYVADE